MAIDIQNLLTNSERTFLEKYTVDPVYSERVFPHRSLIYSERGTHVKPLCVGKDL